MGENELAERIARIMKALANPLRLKILALCLKEEKTSREIREKLGISKPLLIAHLRELVSLGLLEYRVELDRKRMIVRKYYKTKNNLQVCVDTELLELIAREIREENA